MEGTFRCEHEDCAQTEWQAELLPLWVPVEYTPHCPKCGARGWLVDLIVPAETV